MSTMPLFGVVAMMAAMLARPALSNAPESLFDDEVAAVLAAANTYNPLSLSEDREYMGAVIRIGDRFGFTVTAGARGADSVKLRIPEQHIPNIVALWHTHGKAASSNRYFSATDTSLVNRLGKPFYLADYTGYLKVFQPGDPTLSPFVAGRLGLPVAPGYAIGSFVRDRFNRLIRVNLRGGGENSLALFPGNRQLS